MQLNQPARRYLFAIALLTCGLAIRMLFFNLLLVELGYDRQSVAIPIFGELSLLGLLNSVPVLAAALSGLPLWWLVSRVGPPAGLFVGTLLHAVSLAVTATWSAPLPLALGVALGGPAAVLVTVSAAPFMMHHSDDTGRNTLFALSAGFTIGFAGLGSLIGGLLPGLIVTLFNLPSQSAATYQATFAVAAVIAGLAVLPLLANLPYKSTASSERTQILPELKPILTATRHALPFMLSPLLISCGAALLIPFLNLYFRQQFDAPDAALGIIFAAIGIATGVATLAAPLLARHLGQMGSVVLTQLLAIPCLLLLGIAPTLALAALIALIRAALMNMAAPLYDVYAMERTPESARPIVIGLIKGAFSAGYLIGPPISAQIQQSHGFGPLFIATATLYASAALVNAALARHSSVRTL